MKSKRMILAFTLIFLLSVLASPNLAFAAPQKTVPSATAVTPDNALWLEMKEAAKPYQETMRANDQTFKTLRAELAIEVESARQRIEDLLSAAITAEQLAAIEADLAELRELTDAVKADTGKLGQEMTLLRGRKTELDLPGMLLCFENAIAVQEGRIVLVTEAIDLVKAIA